MWPTSSDPARTDLTNDYKLTWVRNSQAKEKVQPSTSHDAQYWTSAAAVCEALAKHLHAKVKLTIWYWVHDENEAKDYGSWWSTFEARRMMEHIQATALEKELYVRQAERITRGGPIPRVIEAMFTTSQIGINVDQLDMKCRQKSEQARFKDNLIEFYDAGRFDPQKPKVMIRAIDTVTGLPFGPYFSEAVHLFPYSLGSESLFALFGEDVKDDLMTARKGLLFPPCVEVALNLGVITLVPDIPDEPTMEQVAAWQEEEPKIYKWRIIDEDAEEYLAGILDVVRETNMSRIRDLDGKRLFFHNENRPHPRYLFFLSAVAQLKMVWRHQYQHRNNPDKKLKLRLGNGFWLTAGKYLNRAFLRALSKEIGHDDSKDEECDGVTENGIWATTGKYLNRALLAVAEQIGYDLSLSDNDNTEEGNGETGLVVIAKIIAAQQCRGGR
ncbi:hypothetical protein QBC37DRAFT_314986 [Rhypophila decipiens]|uniref:HNH nuclease domain-containing protein n=1 Tax=Rhypophila decipiens TaxID=261697 RepID=A0AAN6Y8N5_9PEZI|nr:hypothetical protein QBC37DRAFT_314986 [Rhypophila decipiens]